MEWFEHLEMSLKNGVIVLELALELLAVLCIVIGLLVAARFLIVNREQKHLLLRLRVRFGMWLALALEFLLAADIVGTAIAPSLQALGQLGAIAAIRTFLNYFLNKELEAESQLLVKGKLAKNQDRKDSPE